MDATLPGILLTGASGFVGRNFIQAAAGRFRLFCVARRSMDEAGVEPEPNLRWIQADLSDAGAMPAMINLVRCLGEVDYLVNLAGYYDFTNQENENYARANVLGVRNLLNAARELGVKRFITISSLAACPFGPVVDEDTRPDSDTPYGRSKIAAEEVVRRHAGDVPCAIVRSAAVFSDWCEYPPLYALLGNWLSDRFPDSRVIAGQGLTGLPYIHVKDLAQLILRVIEKSGALEHVHTLNASPDGTVTHLDLYRAATRFCYNKEPRPFLLPLPLLSLAIPVKRALARFMGKTAFEQTWMLKFVDRQLVAGSARTRRELDWEPATRRTLLRRVVFMIENMKRQPDIWRGVNEARLHKSGHRPHLALHGVLCDAMDAEREEAVTAVMSQLTAKGGNGARDPVLRKLGGLAPVVLKSYARLLLQLIVTVIRTVNRPRLAQSAYDHAFAPMNMGFGDGFASHCLLVAGEHLIARFRHRSDFQRLTPGAPEYIAMTIHMAMDRIEDYVETNMRQIPEVAAELHASPPPADCAALGEAVAGLETLCRMAAAGTSHARAARDGEAGEG
jgi:nucleoside-diphosphate-sugar epimerase